MTNLTAFLSKLRQNAEIGHILLVEDSIQASKYVPKYCLPLFVVSITHNILNPSLSFSVFNDSVNRYHRIHDITQVLKPMGIDILSNSFPTAFKTLRSENILLIYKANSKVSLKKLNLFLEICDLVNKYSLQAINIKQNILHNNLTKLKADISNNAFFDIYDLSTYISNSHNGIPVYPFHVMPDKSLIKISSPRYSDKLYDSIAEKMLYLFSNRRQHIYDCIESGRPIAGRSSLHSNLYYIVIPVNEKLRKAFITDILIIASDDPVSHEIVEFILEYIDYYLRYIYSSRRVDILLSAHDRILKTDALRTIKRSDEFLFIFSEFAQTMLDGIVQTTNAFSATLRLFDPYINVLTKISEAKDDMGHRDITENFHKEKNLPIRNWRTIVNAFTFKVGVKYFDYVYLENIKRLNNRIPKIYRDLGLQKCYQMRSLARSEICIPILSGRVPFGTVNIESKIPYAFSERDITYLQGICSTIGHFHSISLFKNDKDWLRQRLLELDGKHELSQFCKLGFFNNHTLNILNDTIFKYSRNKKKQLLSTNKTTFDTIIPEIQKWIDQDYSVLLDNKRATIKQGIISCVTSKVTITTYVSDTIISILKNLIHNTVYHGDIDLDTIVIYYDSPTKEKEHGEFRLRLVTKAWFNPEAFHSATLSPLQERSDRLHYGLFLVGVLTRIHGGNIFLGGNPLAGEVVLESRIPNTQ